MNEQQVELARRAMEIPGWRAVSGMLLQAPDQTRARMLVETESLARRPFSALAASGVAFGDARPSAWYMPPEVVVCLDDPTGATDGALLRMLGPGWRIWSPEIGGVWKAESRNGEVFAGLTAAEVFCRAAIALGRWPGGEAAR